MTIRMLPVLAAATLLGLAACGERGATENPNAPGSPGTGNAADVYAPQAPDTSSGRGPSGVTGSLPHPGSSGGDAVPGTTGGGTASADQPGTGLQGGQGPNAGTAPGQEAGVAEGTRNRTPSGSVGNR